MSDLRRGMIAADGPGWAVTDYDGSLKFGRWATGDEAWDNGIGGVYLLTGVDVVHVAADGTQTPYGEPDEENETTSPATGTAGS